MKALSSRGWFTGGLVAAAVLISLAVPEVSAQPSLVDSSVRIELFFPILTSPTIYRDYGFLPVVAGAPELVSPAGDDEFCGTCTIDIEASSIDRHVCHSSVLSRVVLPTSTVSCSRCQNFAVLSATLTPPRGGNATVSWTGNILRINFGPVPGGADIQAGDNFHIDLVLEQAAEPPASALRFTSSGGQRSGLFYSGSIPTNQGLEITFKQYQYGAVVVPGDGIAFVLAVTPPQPGFIGAGGGDLGYIGMPAGWLGIGFDVFGNFTNTDFSSGCAGPALGHPASAYPNEVTVRGPGNPETLAMWATACCRARPTARLDDPLGPSGSSSSTALTEPARCARSKSSSTRRRTNTYSVAIDPLGGTNYILVTSGPLPSFYYDPSHGRPRGRHSRRTSPSDGPRRPDWPTTSTRSPTSTSRRCTRRRTSSAMRSPGRPPPRPCSACPPARASLASPPAPTRPRHRFPAAAVAGFTTTFAQSVPHVTVPATGSASVTLGNIEIDENSTGVLTAADPHRDHAARRADLRRVARRVDPGEQWAEGRRRGARAVQPWLQALRPST